MTTVAELMSTTLVTLGPDDDLLQAKRTMESERIRHLPVVSKEGALLGLLTHRDLLRAQAEVLEQLQSKQEKVFVPLTASALMTTNVMTTTPAAAAKEAARGLLQNRFGCLPVVDNHKLVGIVTAVDFLRWSLDELG